MLLINLNKNNYSLLTSSPTPTTQRIILLNWSHILLTSRLIAYRSHPEELSWPFFNLQSVMKTTSQFFSSGVECGRVAYFATAVVVDKVIVFQKLVGVHIFNGDYLLKISMDDLPLQSLLHLTCQFLGRSRVPGSDGFLFAELPRKCWLDATGICIEHFDS
jgi:hypothetical protein